VKKEKSFNTKTIRKKDLEKVFKIKLSSEEFNYIKEQGVEDSQVKINGTWISSIMESYKWEFYSKYITPLKKEKERKEKEEKERLEILKYYADNKIIKDDNVDEEKKPIIKEEPSKSRGFDPFFFIPDNAFGGFLIILFFTWLIFSVIFGGGDLEPGAPKFFGHDGG
jgi:hypothetical protein